VDPGSEAGMTKVVVRGWIFPCVKPPFVTLDNFSVELSTLSAAKNLGLLY
jgi:hypothetical protein